MWAYRGNNLELEPRIIVFDYQTSRSGKHVQNFLTAGKATCWSTTMAGTRLYSPKQHHPAQNYAVGRTRAANLFDLHQAIASTVAFEALQRIGKSHAVEAESVNLSTEARQQLRAPKKPADPATVARLVTANSAFIPPMAAAAPPKPSTTLSALAKPDPLRRQRTPAD
ncbi:MAG: transposase [Nitrosomonas sp.]|nr:transposase [Nitrosomonas sp.]